MKNSTLILVQGCTHEIIFFFLSKCQTEINRRVEQPGNTATAAESVADMLIQLTIFGSFSSMMSVYVVVLKFPPVRIEGNK